MSYQERESGVFELSLTRRQLFLGTIEIVLGTIACQNRQSPADGTPSPIEARATVTVRPADTATSTATTTVVPTEAPVPPTKTPTPKPTPPPTETPKPVEKSPLPSYGVWAGNGTLDNKYTKPEQGKVVLASIPQEEGSEKILIYYIMNDRSYNVLLTDLKEVKDNSFKSTNPEIRKVMSAGRYTLQGNFNPSNNTLSGEITERSSSGQTIQVFTFQAESVGNGKGDVLKAAKQMKLATGKYGGNWQTVNVDSELRGINLP